MPIPQREDALPSVAESARDGDLALVCRVRTHLCALPLVHVVETMRPLPVEALAGLPSFVLGLAVIRGAPVAVVDAGALLGATERVRPTRFVTVRVGDRCVALAVEGVLGVRALAPSDMKELPALVRESSDEVISAVGTRDAEFLVVLRAARIVPESLWQTLATVAAG